MLDENGAIIGCLDAANLSPDMPRDRVVSQLAQPVLRGNASDSALRCLQALRKSGCPLMLVHDNKKQPVGLIWIDSLLSLLLDGTKLPKITSTPTKTNPTAPHQA